MAAACLALVGVAAVPVILARVARVVHWARIRDFHDNAGALRSAVTPSVVVASDLEPFTAHRKWAGWTSVLTETVTTAALTVAIGAEGVLRTAAAFSTLPERGSISWCTAVA